MEHNKFAGRFTVILVVLAVGVLGIFWPPTRLFNPDIPWSKKWNLKPGIDISGGTSLVYEIKASGGTTRQDLAQQVADALKRRVDPNGVKNLVWRPQGSNRLEIQMPMSEGSGASSKARGDFARAQAALSATNIRISEVQAALNIVDPAKRAAALQDLAMGSTERTALFDRLAKAQADLAAAEKLPNETDRAIRTVDLRDQINKIQGEIEATNLPPARLESDLQLFQDAMDKAKGNQAEYQKKLNERNAKIAEWKGKYPGFAKRQQAIDTVVAKFDNYSAVKGKMDDAEDLKRMLKGSGVLEFHIAVTDRSLIEQMVKRLNEDGPTPKAGETMRWYMVDRPEEMRGHPIYQYRDKWWMLLDTSSDKSLVHQEGTKQWGLDNATRGTDWATGRPIVNFKFNTAGGVLFGQLTGANVNRPLAIVLDDKVISAPNINQRIEDSGQISGSFTDQDIDYLVRTLNAGSLPARLADEPISERTIGPTLGRDNLRAGLYASFLAIAAVAVFMIVYYHFAGVVATIAVVMNLVIIVGILAMFNATFTLPGIAALALTVGMAVDANVLIFERLREEQHRGLSIRMALRNAYDRAWSAILDSNVTTVATSVILYIFASEDIKGFGLTLAIGVSISMFTALYVTRAIFDYSIERMGVKHLGSLPLSVPAIDRFFKPKIDWMRWAWVFYAVSAVLITAGLICYFSKGRDMYDIEFVSGTSVQVELNRKAELSEVRRRVEADQYRNALPAAQVVAVGNNGTDFEIVTASQNSVQVRDAVIRSLAGLLKVEIPSKFALSDLTSSDDFGKVVNQAVLPVKSDAMSVDGMVLPDAAAYKGGAAIVLRNLSPELTGAEITDRIERMRLESANMPYRDIKVETPDRKDDTKTAFAVVLVSDPDADYTRNPTAWQEQLAQPYWKLVTSAIGRQAQLRGVNSFDASVANDTKIAAIVAVLLSLAFIGIYVWVRFGNLKYGSATLASLLHDVLISIGFIGLSQYLGLWHFANKYLLIEPVRMNLVVIAAVLTVIGYSVNDTIIVFDRIRENRGKLGHINRHVINDSINQTLSRTLLTTSTVIVTLLVMYIWGGPGIHAFTFSLLFGIITGTYSSIAIAAPILLLGGKDVQEDAPEAKAQKVVPFGKQLPRPVGGQ